MHVVIYHMSKGQTFAIQLHGDIGACTYLFNVYTYYVYVASFVYKGMTLLSLCLVSVCISVPGKAQALCVKTAVG